MKRNMQAVPPAKTEKLTARCFRIPAALFAPIAPELWNFVRDFPWDFNCKYEPAECREEILLKLSEVKRRQLSSEHVDLPLAADKRNIRLPNGFTAALSRTLTDHLIQAGFIHSATVSGSMIYPPGGWMGWHTNSDRVGWRLYLNYSTVSDCSFIRWFEDGEIATDYDVAGFNFRLFRIGSGGDLFWHCIYADDWRFSLGLRLPEINFNSLG
jgi:hypothetical protein